jgi:hypothetical protein
VAPVITAVLPFKGGMSAVLQSVMLISPARFVADAPGTA